MKRLLIIIGIIVLVGAGCISQKNNDDQDSVPAFEGTAYENREFGFAFDYPDWVDVNIRKDSNRPHVYSGMDVDFFISIRDIVSESRPVNLAFVYALPGLDVDGFVAALEEHTPGAEVTAQEEVEIHDIKMIKMTNTTEIGDPKTHYLFDQDGTMIILSVFLGEEEKFEPIVKTFRKFE